MSNLGIDGLEDVEQIGTGGSSRVYRARQADLDRIVAVKVLNPGHDQGVSKRFDRERKAMGRLSLHEGIVPVYSSGLTAHGEPYLVMPYYANGSLQDQIDAGPMEWQTAVSYVDVAAETIAVAHDEGVVHLDLKPANILLTNHGAPRIADFGIAKLTSGQGASAGTTGGAAFTPAYSAPETFLDGVTGPPSDVYGLGATLWALLVGHPPFLSPGDDTNLMAVIGRVVNNPVGDLRPSTPDAICDVIERAMAKEPEDRFQTAREFSLALKNAAASASPDFLPANGNRGTMLFPEVPSAPTTNGLSLDGPPADAGPLGRPASSETQMLTRLDPVELPPSIASTAAMPPAEPPPSRPLLQETAQALPQPAGPPPPVNPGPLLDLDRFRFGPMLLGLLAFLGMIGVAFWAINRGSDTEATNGQETSITNPAAPGVDTSTGQSGDDENATDGTGSLPTTATTSSSSTSASASSTNPTTATTDSASSSTDTTAQSTTTTDGSTTESSSTSESTTSTSTSTTESTTTTTATTTTTVPTPGAPTGLSATANDDSVTLTWTAPTGTPAAVSYSVYRDGQLVESVTTNSFTESNLADGRYTYRVRSVASNAERSELSSPASVTVDTTTTTTTPADPTVNITSTASTASSIEVSFMSDQCVTYRVSALDPGAADPTPVVVTGPAGGACGTDHNVTVPGLEAETSYRVAVVVTNEDDRSGSDTATVATPAAAS